MSKRLLLLSVACLFSPHAGAGEFGINLFGLSYHFERSRAAEIDADNEFNPGLGVRYRLPRERMDWLFDLSAYRDSGRRRAVYAGAAAMWKPVRRFGLGLALVAAQSDTYNEGKAFVAPLPLLTLDLGKATVNLTYVPRIREVNEINTLALWFTLWPGRW